MTHRQTHTQGAHWCTGKKYGKYGNFFRQNMGGIWEFSAFFREKYGKIWEVLTDRQNSTTPFHGHLLVCFTLNDCCHYFRGLITLLIC